MLKPFAFIVFGLAAAFLTDIPSTLAAGKNFDMGYIDTPTIMRACHEARATPITTGEQYGCGNRAVNILCDSTTCIATASDLTPLNGDSLQAVVQAMQGRAGRQILPLDTQVQPIEHRAK